MIRHLVLLAAFTSSALFCDAAAAPAHTTPTGPAKWAAAIDQLTANDATQPPAPGGVVFVGSSSIVKWPALAADFPGFNVIKRGFGGSELADSVYYADRIVIPYRPRTVVVYAGDNDIAAGKTPERVRDDFVAFERKMHAALPQARIIFIAIKPSPSRWEIHVAMQQANALVRQVCARSPHCTFVDVWPDMVDAKGEPRRELFSPDMLHMNAAGYAIWRKVLTPVLGQAE